MQMDQRIERKVEALRKIVELEQARGHADKAVVGGIDKFLERWVEDPEIRLYLTNAGIVVPNYANMTQQERADWTRDTSIAMRIGEMETPGPLPLDPRNRSRSPQQPETPESPSLETPGPLPLDPPSRSRTPQRPNTRQPASAMEPEPSAKETPGPLPLHTPPPATAPAPRQRGTKAAPAPRKEPRVAAASASPPAEKKRSASPPAPPRPLASLDEPLPTTQGTPQATLDRMAKMGVATYRDALFHFPFRHDDFSRQATVAELLGGLEQTVHVTVESASERPMGKRMKSTEATVYDETGSVRAVWFNQPFLARTFRPGVKLALSGRVGLFRNRPVLENPEYEFLNGGDTTHTGRLVPVYPLTDGLYQRTTRRIIRSAIDRGLPLIEEFLPPDTMQRATLVDRRTAIGHFHFPDDDADKDRARRRLAFEELLLMQLGVLARRRDWHDQNDGLPMTVDLPILERFRALLPYTLTGAQDRSLSEILNDMERDKPMSRLLQGEVGSGKTVVATAALLVALANGYQGALMAPTEVLAEQHFQTITRILSPAAVEEDDDERGPFRGFRGLLDRPLRIALLVGSQTRGEKRALHSLIRQGAVDIAIGTHALIQEGVEFANLGLAIVDEQHRFGVEQRAALRSKGPSPHLMVMTATPIPRTLALTLYGDLDISTIDELPPGRQEIKTRALTPQQRNSAYEFIRDQVKQGRQAFVICPLVEESDAIEARAATVEHERLSRDVFPELRVGLLHGRMKPQEKDAVMTSFRDGDVDILVSTAVVEVGIDVPNATVMMVDGAERFGMSQLHQYRGRVGRGEHQSYCILLSDSRGVEARQRLEIVERTRDGFELAEEDLKLRGPGEFFGTRQSGVLDVKMAQLSDTRLLEQAREEASRLFENDADLQAPEHAALKAEMARFWRDAEEAPG